MIAPKFAAICVTWLDAHSEYDNCNSNDVAKAYRKAIRRTIGWLVYQDKERVVVAMDDDRGVGGSDDIQTVTTIPIGMVIDLTQYRPMKPAPKKKPKK